MTNLETIEPAYVVDTNVLIWHLTQPHKLSQRAKAIFQAAHSGETKLIVSAMSVAEMFYANSKWGLFTDFNKTYSELKAEPYFIFAVIEPDHVLDFAQDSAVPEMHDRIIAGLARRLGVPLLTYDPLIEKAGIVRVEW